MFVLMDPAESSSPHRREGPAQLGARLPSSGESCPKRNKSPAKEVWRLREEFTEASWAAAVRARITDWTTKLKQFL